MKKTTSLLTTLITAITLSFCTQASAVMVTFFGDFVDSGLAAGPHYDSVDAPLPGSFGLFFSEMVVGIPKFDPSLGTLTDITVFVEPDEPGEPNSIHYEIFGSIDVSEDDDTVLTGFTGVVEIVGDVGLNYETPTSSLSPIISDMFFLSGGCAAAAMDGDCDDGLLAEGMLTGSESVFGLVDLADFIGAGTVDSLFVQLFLPATAGFALDNATATADIEFDIFAGISAPATDSIVGVTYTFTPVPEPSSLAMFGLSGLILGYRGRRRKSS